MKCAGCEDYEGSKRQVSAHQANPHTDCSTDDGIIDKDTPEPSENKESDHLDKGNEERKGEEQAEIQEETHETPENSEKDEPDFAFQGTRNEGDHVFEDEEVPETLENEEDEDAEEEKDEDKDQKDSQVEKREKEELDVDPAFFQLFHKGINKGLRKLFDKFFGFKPDTLEDDELHKMGAATEVLAENRLSRQQRHTLEKAARGQGVIGGHAKAMFRGLVQEETETSKEEPDDKEKQESEDTQKLEEKNESNDSGFGEEDPWS